MGEFSEPTEVPLVVSDLYKKFKITERGSEGLLWNDNNNWKAMKRFMGYHSASYLRAVIFGRFKYHLLSSNEKAVHTSNLEPSQIFDEHYWTSLSGMNPLHISMVQNFRHLTSWIFPCLGDRLEMAHGIEGRTPFLDNDVVGFVATIPPEFLLNMAKLREKRVLYDAFQDDIPQLVKEGHKHPFFAPSWKSIFDTAPGRQLFDKHTSFNTLRQASIFKPWIVTVLSWIWRIIPSRLILHRKLDAVMGVVLTVQILYAHFIQPLEDAPISIHVKKLN